MLRDYPDSDNIFNFKEYNKAYCNSWVATAVIGSAGIGALTTAYTSNKAASTQATAAEQGAAAQKYATDQATAVQNNQLDFTKQQAALNRSTLAPFVASGTTANDQLQAQLPFLTSPITMDEATLQQTPGYQFNLTQGLKAVQNSAAARGLGVSGAALKGAATFATGLADNTYQNQFNNENTNRTNAYNRLKGLVDTGESAAAQTGVISNQATQTGAGITNSIGANTIAGGNAIQGGLVGAANANAAGYNALGGAVGNLANNVGGYAAYKGLYGNNNTAGGNDSTLNG